MSFIYSKKDAVLSEKNQEVIEQVEKEIFSVTREMALGTLAKRIDESYESFNDLNKLIDKFILCAKTTLITNEVVFDLPVLKHYVFEGIHYFLLYMDVQYENCSDKKVRLFGIVGIPSNGFYDIDFFHLPNDALVVEDDEIETVEDVYEWLAEWTNIDSQECFYKSKTIIG